MTRSAQQYGMDIDYLKNILISGRTRDTGMQNTFGITFLFFLMSIPEA